VNWLIAGLAVAAVSSFWSKYSVSTLPTWSRAVFKSTGAVMHFSLMGLLQIVVEAMLQLAVFW
jgi:hypothetical protein